MGLYQELIALWQELTLFRQGLIFSCQREIYINKIYLYYRFKIII
jgi:hypothetical protein